MTQQTLSYTTTTSIRWSGDFYLAKKLKSILLKAVAACGEIGREGCEISSLVEHMGLSPWLFL